LWAVCLICAVGCLPWAVLLRTLPDRHFGVVFNAVVAGIAFVSRPLVKGFNALGRGIKSFFKPLGRFTRRVFSRRETKTADSSQSPLEIELTTPVRDEEAPAEPKIIRQGSSERPRTPPAIAVPPILVTTSP